MDCPTLRRVRPAMDRRGRPVREKRMIEFDCEGCGTHIVDLGSVEVRASRLTCPRCGMTSWHPRDVAEGYCGKCHDWTAEPCVPGMSGSKMAQSSGTVGEKPRKISS